MKSIVKQSKSKAAFTIVELLTVMSIIVILIGLLVPALNKVRVYAQEVKQNAQFHSIEAAIELFNNAFEGYPESQGVDTTGVSYCGAMKLCEAMMGQDLLGFHSNSIFLADGYGAGLYMDPAGSGTVTPDLTARKGPYLSPESADAVEIREIWTSNMGQFLPTSRVLCDVFKHRLESGKKVGMPILYYKANTRGRLHRASLAASMTPVDSQNNIYNFLDNQELLDLGIPGAAAGGAAAPFPLSDPVRFYKNTLSDKVTTVERPFNADTYIMISAGYDGEYGTADDICNFEWRYED
jgi:type II secretory pathway pseudopilin PulG